jgi:hypothetical protein
MEDITKVNTDIVAEVEAVPGRSQFVIGVAITHIYSVPVEATSTDDAIMQMDDWLRGTTPPDAFSPEIVSSDLNVIGVGVPQEDGRLSEAPPLSDEARAELRARGSLPDTGSTHLFPEPPRAAVTSTGEVVDLAAAEVVIPVLQ